MAKPSIVPTKNKRNDLTAEYVRSILDYNPEMGEFRWKKNKILGKITGQKTNGKGYRQIWINDASYLSHRLAWLWVMGKWPKEQIDHKDGNRANKWKNLRESSQQQNCFNRQIIINTKSGYKGVFYHAKTKKWRASICIKRKKKHLGVFLSAESAHAAYCAAAKKLYGSFFREK